MPSRSLLILPVVAALAVGCSDSSAPSPQLTGTSSSSQPATKPSEPLLSSPGATSDVQWEIASVADGFMRSILMGDAAAAAELLTTKAAERYALDPTVLGTVGMPADDVEVGEVRLLSSAEAAAQCLVRPTGSETTVELCCLLKQDQDGWRVCGIASDVEGAAPTVISFEGTPAVSPEQLAEGESTPVAPRTAAQPGAADRR
ncbi:MAG: hypothetical protein AAF266_06575 [Planctomycetota bacterium]